METVNGEFIMKACDADYPQRLMTIENLYELIDTIGFIPLFANSIPGFSVEERVTADQWWTEDRGSDPWEWRQIASRHPDIAYGKFFDSKAGFISKKWFPAFANYRREGYDFEALFEDEKASYRAKQLMDIFEMDDESVGKEMMSYEIKANYSDKGFDRVLTELQMQTYLIMSDFRQKKNKKGQPYGWHIAAIETPETKWGYDFVTSCYNEDPKVSCVRIIDNLREHFPDAEDSAIIQMLTIRRASDKKAVKEKNSAKKTRDRKNIRPQELPWPENLITEIGVDKALEKEAYEPLTDDQTEGLLFAMSTIKPREEQLIKCRYQEHMTLQECADTVGRSKERVRQIIALGVRKLRHPSRTQYIRKGYLGVLEENEQKRQRYLQPMTEEERMELLSEIRIGECGMNVRAYNCLMRANIFTLADVKSLMDTDPDGFIKIRNLGTKSRMDVIEKMEEYGVNCSAVRKAAECIHYP